MCMRYGPCLYIVRVNQIVRVPIFTCLSPYRCLTLWQHFVDEVYGRNFDDFSL